MEVLIDNRQSKIIIEKGIETLIEKVIEACLIEEKKGLEYEVSVSIVDNDEIHRLNKNYRGIDRPTDVLSFPMEEEGEDYTDSHQLKILGDIVLSAEKALEQSKEYDHTFDRELAYLTAHSMFHLMGYDHETEDEKESMRDKEKQIMKRLGIFK